MRASISLAFAATLVLLATSTAVDAHGGCKWKHGCYERPVTPQYFRYRPPSLNARCFASRYGAVHCPYTERPAWWRGCWMNRYGRMVCNKGKYW